MAAGAGDWAVLATAALFGLTTFPIFSVATAHAHDFAASDQRVELSAALMFFYATGAIAAPLVTSNLIEYFGPSALFYFVSAAHVMLVLFGLTRKKVRATPDKRTSYVVAPRTSFLIGRLTRRNRDGKG